MVHKVQKQEEKITLEEVTLPTTPEEIEEMEEQEKLKKKLQAKKEIEEEES